MDMQTKIIVVIHVLSFVFCFYSQQYEPVEKRDQGAKLGL